MTAPALDEAPDRALQAPDGTTVTIATMDRWHFGTCRDAGLLTLVERLTIAARLEGLDRTYPPLSPAQLVDMARVNNLAGVQ